MRVCVPRCNTCTCTCTCTCTLYNTSVTVVAVSFLNRAKEIKIPKGNY